MEAVETQFFRLFVEGVLPVQSQGINSRVIGKSAKEIA